MVVKILAIAPNDGWGFIEFDGRLFLLRPPYASNLIEVSKKDLQKAIHSYGFEECDVPHDDLNETVNFLKKTYIESNKRRGIDLPTSEDLRELLKFANQDNLSNYLRKAQEELIPEGKLEVAEEISRELLKLNEVKNTELFGTAIGILEKCSQERRKLIEFPFTTDWQSKFKKQFPNLAKKYTRSSVAKIQGNIFERKQILAITG